VSWLQHGPARKVPTPALFCVVRTISYTSAVRVGAVLTLPLLLQAVACGGVVARTDAGGAGAGAGRADTGGVDAGRASTATAGTCAEPAFVVPDAGVFHAPPIDALGTYQVTFHNRCAQTVWPAWASTGGLDASVVDTQVWLPMAPTSDRTVTVYGGVREVAFWGRTGCNFDQTGSGTCQTGECGGFICGRPGSAEPNRLVALSTTIFLLEQGFSGGYNLGLRVEGPTCGDHECVADLRTCPAASAASDACGQTIACSDICGGSSSDCCPRPGSGCSEGPSASGAPDVGDLVVTFCP